MTIRTAILESLLAILCPALIVFGCAVPSERVQAQTFVVVDFTDAGLALTHDEATALRWAQNDEYLVIDAVRGERVYPDGSREKIGESK